MTSQVKTLEILSRELPPIPTATVWLLNDLAEYRGKQELYTRQAPQRLKKLREHALIESAVASNRIEGVTVDRKREVAVVMGKAPLQDRNEQEVRGYQTALSWVHAEHESIVETPATILKFHAMTRPGTWDGGQFKEADGEIIEKHPDGRVTVRFRPLSARETPDAVARLCDLSARLLREQTIPPLIVWAAQNLDFLCIHPFRDGNGRVSRLLLLLSLYHLGFEGGRYISLERLIEQSKERYYETLQQSSQGWHEGRHDFWPYVNYLLYTLKELYAEFERRVGERGAARGEKTESVREAISACAVPFHIGELQRRCPGVSLDMIRKVLKDLRKIGEVACTGRGKHAMWRVMGNKPDNG
ncbi:MAG: Fic family protein [Eubacteriales bacterium]|jgi:Fic family protein|nr:Fic family protein [Eubacteriales bacterium]